MTIQERQTLGHNINFLSTEQLIGIYNIVKDCINGQTDTLEFDLKELPDVKCRQLETYVVKCIKDNEEKKK
jgi:Bromodomain extra-terminal - transcription regulation